MVDSGRTVVVKNYRKAVTFQGCLHRKRVGGYLLQFLTCFVTGTVGIEVDNLVHGIRAEERVHLLRKLLLVVGNVCPKLLDDVKTVTIVFLLSHDERLEVARVVAHIERFSLIVVSQIACREQELVFEVKFQYLIIDIAILELMSLVVVGSKELIGYFLVPNGTDSRKELVHIEGVELCLEELGTENILIAERRRTDIVDGVTAHICKAWLPSCHKGIESLAFQSYFLHNNRILCAAQLLLKGELLVKRLVDGKRHAGYLLNELTVHLVLIFLEPVVLT